MKLRTVEHSAGRGKTTPFRDTLKAFLRKMYCGKETRSVVKSLHLSPDPCFTLLRTEVTLSRFRCFRMVNQGEVDRPSGSERNGEASPLLLPHNPIRRSPSARCTVNSHVPPASSATCSLRNPGGNVRSSSSMSASWREDDASYAIHGERLNDKRGACSFSGTGFHMSMSHCQIVPVILPPLIVVDILELRVIYTRNRERQRERKISTSQLKNSI